MKRAVIALLLLANVAKAAPKNGLSYIGLCNPNWNCNQSLTAFDKEIVTGWLDNTFAPDCKCGQKILADKRPKTVRVSVLNGPCLRNRRCGAYEVLAGETVQSAEAKILKDDPKITAKYRARLAFVRDLLSKATNPLTCYVSPCLECDFSSRARLKLISQAKEVIPQCQIVDNPLRDACLPGQLCETHGGSPKPANINDLDGSDYYAVNGSTYYNSNPDLIRYWWTAKFNMHDDSGTFVDPRQRNSNIAPDSLRVIAKGASQKNAWTLEDNQSKAKCQRIEKSSDGLGGFVFKTSDTKTNGKEHVAIAVFPNTFQRFKGVSLISKGKVFDKLEYVYNLTEDKSNRQVWKSKFSAADLPKNLVLQADNRCWLLDNPAWRYD